MDPASAAWSQPLAFIADLCTVPAATADIADIRDSVLFVALAALLIVIAIHREPERRTPPAVSPGPSVRDSETSRPANPPLRWLLQTGLAVICIAILSAVANDSWSTSTGWILRTAAGILWAVLIGRYFDDRMIRSTLHGMLVVGVVAIALAVLHRADRHLANFVWPIGPITATATMSTVWLALAAGAMVGSGIRRDLIARSATYLMIAVFAAYALAQTARRGPAVAILGAALLMIAHERWAAAAKRMHRVAILSAMAAAVGLGWFYVVHELNRADRVASGAVNLRFEYWKLSLDLVREHLSLGAGPDNFIARMTTTVAPLRGISPHVYHGTIDADAHNEWIQAAVELGVPGALFWAAIPVGVLLLVWRPCTADPLIRDHLHQPAIRARYAFGDPARRPLTLALGGALLAILLAECSGIMLRGPILPVWYWTIIGLLCACAAPRSVTAQPRADARHAVPGRRHRALIVTLPALVASSACLLIAWIDLSNANVRAPEEMIQPAPGDQRLYSLRTLELWRRGADRASARAAQSADPTTRLLAVDHWRRLYDWIPGAQDTAACYAAALLDANNRDEAHRVLDRVLRFGLDPYEPSANLLYARAFTDDPNEKFESVLRALRHTAIANGCDAILDEIGDPADIAGLNAARLQEARKSALAMQPVDWDDAAGELLRAYAHIAWRAGRTDEALNSQRAAAALYTYLEAYNSPFRRGHDAETDVYFSLAAMLRSAGPQNLDEAYKAIVAAERYAVLGIKHEFVADPDPNQGYVGGIIVPTEFPERLYPLWRLSAQLRVESGNEDLVELRILSYLPPDARTPQVLQQNIQRELARLRAAAKSPAPER